MSSTLPCTECGKPIRYQPERLTQAIRRWHDYANWLHYCPACIPARPAQPGKALVKR